MCLCCVNCIVGSARARSLGNKFDDFWLCHITHAVRAFYCYNYYPKQQTATTYTALFGVYGLCVLQTEWSIASNNYLYTRKSGMCSYYFFGITFMSRGRKLVLFQVYCCSSLIFRIVFFVFLLHYFILESVVWCMHTWNVIFLL